MSEQYTRIKTLQFVLHWILIFYVNSVISESNCKKRCNAEVGNATSYGNGELFCNQECKLNQCNWGCDNYQVALNSSCQLACKEGWTIQQGTISKTRSVQQTEREYCNQGCSTALDLYFKNISNSLGPLPAPELKTGYKNHSSVVLHWVGKIHPNVTYYVQTRVVDTHSNWHIYNNSQIDSNGDINITDLLPYVTYKFKILLVVTASLFLSTNESEPITTLPFGAPTYAPTIKDVSAPTPTVISVSWDPPVFTNGPLVGYHLTLTPINRPTLHPINREVAGNMTSWTFRQLQSSQMYKLSVTAQNADGDGPSDTANITTPNPGNLSAEEMPYLILAADNKVLKQNMKALLTNDPDQLTNKSSTAQIKGIGVNINKQILLVSDSTNRIHLVDVNRKEKAKVVLSVLEKPTAISIDWLNDLSYVVDEFHIYQCNVTSDLCIKAIGPLPTIPGDIKTDPVNGYLYFTQRNENVGIYRVDLGEITPTKPAKYQQVISCPLLTFSIDYGNIQLYFPNESQNTMQSSFLDGSGIVDLREDNVVQPNFYNIVSMVHYKGIFYWTNGSKVLKEDYDESKSTFYHNSIWFSGHTFSSFNIYQPGIQPKPVPHSCPQNVQALFTDYKVYIQWNPPKKLSYQGQGAWNKWSYEVLLLENDGSKNEFLDNVQITSSEISNLEPDTSYLIKVRAKSDAGVGPWSNIFSGRTLTAAASNATVVAASYFDYKMRLTEVDMFGKVVADLYEGPRRVIDMTWTDNTIVMILEDNIMYALQNVPFLTIHPLFKSKAASLAYDWLGKKLYWSDAGLGVIRRSDILEPNIEFVAQGLARHIAIDAVGGRLYWVTINRVESSFLNGENHVTYFSEPLFSGKQVISLTLNFDLKKILWYVRGFEQQELYISDLIQGFAVQEDIHVQMVGNFHSISDSSVLQYHAHRIFWQNNNGAVVVGDLEVNHTSVITNGGVSAFFVQHSSLHPYPSGLNSSTVQVVPSRVPSDSITCTGVWSKVNLTWNKANLNYGHVFYEVSVKIQEDQNFSLMMQTEKTWHEISGIQPYMLLLVTIRAYTYWGYGPVTTVEVRSPMSVPSEPLTPRVYVTQRKDGTTAENSMAADFRWSAPGTSNGRIVRYIVSYWDSSKENMQLNRTGLPRTARHFILPYLKPNTTYYFQVQACTDVGCGNKSVKASARPNAMNPVPQLLLSTPRNILLTEIDTVKNTSVTLDTARLAVALTYLAQDDRRFWINSKYELYETSKNGTKKLLVLNDTAQDMAIDWISRTLYIVVLGSSGMSSQIIRYLIDQKVFHTTISRSTVITSIAAEPYSSTIFWTEKVATSDFNTLYRFSRDQGVNRVFSTQRGKRDTSTSCNCSSSMQLGDVITLDHSQDRQTEILVYDLSTGSIITTDREGCHCRILVTPTQGTPPDLMAVDHLHVYWYNKGNNSLYAMEKDSGKINVHTITDVIDMQAYGSHLQPLPSSECLYPGAYNGTLTLVSNTNVSITVQLENVTWPTQCQNLSHPATKYTLYYKQKSRGDNCDPTGTDCQEQISYSQIITIHKLEPFTDYTVQGAVSNYYTEYLSEVLSRSNFYKTAIGVPSPVTNVNATVKTPNNVTVEWNLPLKPNGPMQGLKYVVQYSTLKDNGVYQEANLNVTGRIDNTGKFVVLLSDLLAGHQYRIKVLASNSEKRYYSESQVVEVKTFLTPGPIEFVSSTNDSITISWKSPAGGSIRSHLFKYGKVTNGEVGTFQVIHSSLGFTRESKTYEYEIGKLEPNTEYVFIMKIVHRNGESYEWPYDRKLTYKYKTQAFIPEAPGQPKVRKLKSTTGYEVVWEKPNDNGEMITNYILYFCKSGRDICSRAYNGSDVRWIIEDNIVPPGNDYVFRVAAENAIGLGPFSNNSIPFKYLETQTNDDNIAVLAISLSFVFVFVVVVIMIICYVIKRRNDGMHKPTQFIAVSRGPDMELATLRELPHTAIQQSNTLYAINIIPTDGDIATLPHFRRDQLMLTKFLGSGAFGEVFEGLAKNILSDSSGETKVAVKTLRKSASDHEKEEFLKEALLMSNFKHDHILRLLGVCLDNDPQFIILELMEGGDLLSFLRGCRPSVVNPAYLCLTDLIKVCVHVARGCKYLEEMHFVHRDLAARNCLVSTKNPADMVVKIGDFGLARDIYKNDYYRKEGEGLLPVRWMSPESLVDGVFTTQSDIWAFGVLMWEVLTFGQQPYQARTNIEVLHFVRSGGKLDQPENCPEEIFLLMKKCWNPDPEDRPSFSLILKQLEEFHEKCVVLLQDYIMPIRTCPPPTVDGYISRGSYLYGHFEPPGKIFKGEKFALYDVPKFILQTKHDNSVKKKEQHAKSDISDQGQSVKSNKSVDGYNHVQHTKRTKRQKHRTSSLGHDPGQKEPQNMYRKIQHATSFDSPEPRDACIVDTTCDYLNPKTYGTPAYLELISDPSDLHSDTFIGKSRKVSQSSYQTSQSSRHSSCSSDIYSHPIGQNLRVNLPPLPVEQSILYEQIHSTDTDSGKYMPYAVVSSSIPEDPDILENYDIVPGNLYPSKDSPIPEGYSVIRGPPRRLSDSASRQGQMFVDCPPKRNCLSTSSSDDVKMSLMSSNTTSASSVTSGEAPCYMEYDPASSNETDNRKFHENPRPLGSSSSAELCLNYDRPVINRPYNSAEARLVYDGKTTDRKAMIHNLALTDSNYVDCNKNRSYIALSNQNNSNCSVSHIPQDIDCTKTIQYWANNNKQFPAMPHEEQTDNGRLGGRQRSQVYPVDGAPARAGYGDLVQASLV